MQYKCWFIGFLRCLVIDLWFCDSVSGSVILWSCWGLLHGLLETALTTQCSWQGHGQGLRSPKEAEESWVMMAQTFCHLDKRVQQPLGSLVLRGCKKQCYCGEQPSALPTSLGRAPEHPQPTLHLAIQELNKCFPIMFPLLLSATAK